MRKSIWCWNDRTENDGPSKSSAAWRRSSNGGSTTPARISRRRKPSSSIRRGALSGGGRRRGHWRTRDGDPAGVVVGVDQSVNKSVSQSTDEGRFSLGPAAVERQNAAGASRFRIGGDDASQRLDVRSSWNRRITRPRGTSTGDFDPTPARRRSPATGRAIRPPEPVPGPPAAGGRSPGRGRRDRAVARFHTRPGSGRAARPPRRDRSQQAKQGVDPNPGSSIRSKPGHVLARDQRRIDAQRSVKLGQVSVWPTRSVNSGSIGRDSWALLLGVAVEAG